MMVTIIDIALLVLLAATALTIVRMRNLFAATMLMGIYSLLSAGLFVTMDAMDVAFTEAAVGAGVSTVLMLGTLALVGREERAPGHNRQVLPLFVTVVTGAILVYGSVDMPPFGDPSNPVHQHVAPYYLDSYEETHIPNVVTSVLGSYRGYDTMGETAVVFTALVGVLLLLGPGRGKHRPAEPGPGTHPPAEGAKRSRPGYGRKGGERDG